METTLGSDWVTLSTGGEALVCRPAGPARGLAVVAGELFGVTDYVASILRGWPDTGSLRPPRTSTGGPGGG